MAGSSAVQAGGFDKAAHVDATKKEWLRRQRVYKEMYYAKSKYPPMNIEPFPLERQRLPFKMSGEDRALRQQWLRDQHLTATEPRHIPELRPRNIFRRMFGYPWDVITKMVTRTMGVETARTFRYFGPKFGMYFAAVAFVANYIKHNTSTWEKVGGVQIYSSKLATYPGVPLPRNPWGDHHEKSRGDFNNKKFSNRNVYLELS